jgi:iron complex transport system substrate-binding protein
MRIVSLLPSATEILFGIGAGAEVVAVTHECDHPEQALSLPRATASAIDHTGQTCAAIDRHITKAVHSGSSIYRLDEDLLRELSPDLIVTQELCDVCAVAFRQVQRAARRLPGEVPVLSLEPASLEDICATVEAVGAAADHVSEAHRLASRMRDQIAALERLPPLAEPPRVACIEWTEPLMAGGHWVPEMVELAGGIDALGHAGMPSHYITWDGLVAAEPEILVLMPCGFDLDSTLAASRDLTTRPEFGRLPCARSGRVVAVDGSSYYNRPGPRIVDGLEIMAAILRARPGEALPLGASWVAKGS